MAASFQITMDQMIEGSNGMFPYELDVTKESGNIFEGVYDLESLLSFHEGETRELYHDFFHDSFDTKDSQVLEFGSNTHPAWAAPIGLGISSDIIDIANDSEDLHQFYQTPPESSKPVFLGEHNPPPTPKITQEAVFQVGCALERACEEDIELPELDSSDEEGSLIYADDSDEHDRRSAGNSDDDPEYVDEKCTKSQRGRVGKGRQKGPCKRGVDKKQAAPACSRGNAEKKCEQVQSIVKEKFTCSDCGKGFDRKSNRDSHARVHLTIKPHGCTLCGRKFARNSDRKRHEKSHCKEVSLCCRGKQRGVPWGCGMRFASGKDIKAHWDSVSGNDCLITFINALKAAGSKAKLSAGARLREKSSDCKDFACMALLQLERQQRFRGGKR